MVQSFSEYTLSWEWDGQDAALNVILGSRGWCKNRWSTSNCKTSDVKIFDGLQSTNQMIADDFLNITFHRVIDAVVLCPLSLVHTENPNLIEIQIISDNKQKLES